MYVIHSIHRNYDSYYMWIMYDAYRVQARCACTSTGSGRNNEWSHFSSIEKAILHRLRVSAWPGDVYLKYYRPSCTFWGFENIPGFGGAGALKSAIWKKSHFYEKECVIMFMSLKVSYGSQSLTLSFWSWSQQPWSAHISWSNEVCNA